MAKKQGEADRRAEFIRSGRRWSLVSVEKWVEPHIPHVLSGERVWCVRFWLEDGFGFVYPTVLGWEASIHIPGVTKSGPALSQEFFETAEQAKGWVYDKMSTPEARRSLKTD